MKLMIPNQLKSISGDTVGAFSCVCEEDAQWLPQYLAESERLGMPFVMHFDRCSKETQRIVRRHPNMVACTVYEGPEKFSERTKQQPYQELKKRKFTWAMTWDVDETFCKDAVQVFKEVLSVPDVETISMQWLNLWGSPDFLRIDEPFCTRYREKLYKLIIGFPWEWKCPLTNGPTLYQKIPRNYVASNLVCLHHGLMTHELRLAHKLKWDRVYGRSGGNPYNIWNHLLDYENCPPEVTPNPY